MMNTDVLWVWDYTVMKNTVRRLVDLLPNETDESFSNWIVITILPVWREYGYPRPSTAAWLWFEAEIIEMVAEADDDTDFAVQAYLAEANPVYRLLDDDSYDINDYIRDID